MPTAIPALEEEFCQPEAASPEQNLVAAILARVVADARGAYHVGRPFASGGAILEAIRWIQYSEDLAFFADALGMDEDFLRQQLMIECGLSDATPRLGERREPRPRQRGLDSRECDLEPIRSHQRKPHTKVNNGKSLAGGRARQGTRALATT